MPYLSFKSSQTNIEYPLEREDLPKGFDPDNPEHIKQITDILRDQERPLIEEKALKQEEKRQFWQAQELPKEGSAGKLAEGISRVAKSAPGIRLAEFAGASPEAFAQGALDTALAGTPKAIAAVAQGDKGGLEGPGSYEQGAPKSYAAGEIAGALVPLGQTVRLASGVAKQAVRSGAVPKLVQFLTGGPGRKAAGQGARLGGVYGAGARTSEAIVEGERDPLEVAQEAAKGAAVGAPMGAALGGLAGWLGSYAKDVFQLSEEAKRQLFTALKAGNRGEGDPGKYQEDIVQAMNVLGQSTKKGTKPITNIAELEQRNQGLLDKEVNDLERQLTRAGAKGVVVPGDQLALEAVRNAVFPFDFQKQLSSAEVQALDEGISALMRLKGKRYEGLGLDNIARQLLDDKGFFASVPKETRIALINRINDTSREGPGLSGSALMAQGLRGLHPSQSTKGFDPGLNLGEDALQGIVAGTEKFGGKEKKWLPWELEDRIRKINDEMADIERKVPEANKDARMAQPDVASLKNEQNLLRTKLDEIMSPGPNGQFREQKRKIGALMRLRRVAQGAQLAERESKGTRPTEGFEGKLERVSRAPSSLAAVARLKKTDRDLSPSERIKKAFVLWQESQRQPNRLGRLVGPEGSMLLLRGVKDSPVTRLGVQEEQELVP